MAESTTAHRVAAALSARVLAVVILGLSSVLLARVLQPDGRGTFGVVVAFAAVAAIVGHLSIEQSVVLRWQLGDDRRALASTALLIGVVSGLLAAIGGWIIVSVATGAFSADDRALIVLVLPAIPLSIVSGYLIGLTVLDGRTGRVNVARTAAASCQLLVLVALWRFGWLTVASAVVVWVVALGALPVVVLTPGLSIRLRHVSSSAVRRLFRTGVQYHVGMVALFMLRRVDVFILNAWVDREQVGLYVVAVVVAELMFLPGESIAQVTLSRQVAGDLDQAADYTARVVRLNTIVGVCAAVALAILSPVIFRFGFGPTYSGSLPLLLWLLPGVVAIGLIRPVTVILVRLDRPFVVSLVCIGALAVDVALNLMLIPRVGVAGASIASSIAYIGQAAAYTVWLLHRTSLRPADLVPRWRDLGFALALIRRRGSAPAIGSSAVPEPTA